MQMMRALSRLAVLCGATAVVACAKPADQAANDSSAAAAAAAMTPAPAPTLSLADLAGKWTVNNVPESGADTTPTVTTMTVTADGTGSTYTFANGLVVPVTVTVSGDSLMTSAGPYASVRRSGKQVTTQGVLRRDGDGLRGTTTARYAGGGADSVLVLRSTATRAP